MDRIISLAKRRGFIFQGSEIYGGLAGTWDYGPLGLALKNNLKNLWWRKFVEEREDMFGLDAAILMNPQVWAASGHLAGFADPLPPRSDLKDQESQGRTFNLMFKTEVGARGDSAVTVYLRPETAQGIFVNFKNIIDSFHPKLPFGVAQIGKAFRNEITPRDFLFRLREFEQMEIEYFVKEEQWVKHFEVWRQLMRQWLESVGLDQNLVHEVEVPVGDRAHYSERTIDFEFDYPFGRKELCGLAYRTDFDLRQHAASSGADLNYLDEATKEKITLHVIEPTFGLDRLILAVLCSVYAEDEMNGEKRIVLRFKPELAPVRVAVFPLLANKPELVAKARAVFSTLKADIYNLKAVFDDNGNIGKRYRRQDEIGTPWCVTIDFQTLEDETVTVRDRDTGQQARVKIEELPPRLA
ncbi:MAG: glycine--tRNA ligase [Candidatus Vogelbacteria bacterium]|nr:glycine--tRNA ligase [Candidatus Vogelbacteria bacterium]